LGKKVYDKVNNVKKNNSRIKLSIIGIGSVALCFVMIMFALNALAGQKNTAFEGTSQESIEQKKVNIDIVNAGSYTFDDPYLEEIIPETEAATETPVEEAPAIVELTPISELVIAPENLAVEAPHQEVEVVEEAPASTSTYEMSKLVYGIDVSRWQGNIDWAQVKADGVDFAMIKMGGRDCGDGSLYLDSCFEKNIQGALANGVQVGIYFFSQAVNEQEALDEASFVIETIRKYKITYPVAFDWESAAGYRVANAGLSKDSLTRIVSVFCDTVASYGYTPMSYFCRNDWYNSVNGADLSGKYKSWLAVYWGEYYNDPNARNWYNASSGELPNFNYSFQMWQYTSRGHVAGISGRVDMDIALFTYGNYQVDKSPVTLTVPSSTITTNVGVAVDLRKGVSATNSIGYDVTKDISIAVIDWAGDDVSSDPNYAISNPGKYTVFYRYKDPAGEKKEVTVTLNVRSAPTLTFKSPDVTYIYNYSINPLLNKEALLKLILDNGKALSFEGKGIVVSTNVASKIPDATIGIYTITYTADDGLGLLTTVSGKVTIANGESQTNGQ